MKTKSQLLPVFFKVLYGPALCLFSMAYLPKFVMRLGQANDKSKMFRERFGCVENPFPGQPLICIHAVSVGEVLATKEFIRMFHISHPDHKIILTTTTPTGQSLAKKMESEFLRAAYFPMDFGSSVRHFLDAIKPRLIVIMETEIWPNLIKEASQRRIPIGIMNGRISDRAIKRYLWVKEWFGELMNHLQFLSVRNEQDRDRFIEMGVNRDKVVVTGNMKFDIDADRNAVQTSELRLNLGFQDKLVIVAGSTHEGEEELILRIFQQARTRHQNLKLVLAPRHIERAADVWRLVVAFPDLKVSLFSANHTSDCEVLILDTMGELSKFYGVADFVFIGGSLIPHGGQNPIEAARERRAIIHGPYIHNFHDVYSQLDREKGAVLVHNESELQERINDLINNEQDRKALGLQAFEVVDRLRGASQRNLQLLGPWLNN